ncbi:fibroblast growth factor 23-like [Solea senegalensis]|uniref:Fibroblast growth factor 23-like n=1 Tax=Solea senegalensis TaxID=28829 RepID=A0AAV6SZW8_SOLSE|nr:fibroblast growth factor 23-like [Solea senegalensis]KAG7522655.1 fibroblast growth factor 23-like [Solea senegalensis]
MRPAFFSLTLTACVCVSVMVDCRPRVQDTEHLPHHHHQHIGGASADTGHFYSELSGSIKRVHRKYLVVLPVTTDTSNIVSIFDLRRQRYLCMNLKKELYVSRHMDKEDCLFQLLSHYDTFYPASGGKLLKLERTKDSSALLHRFPGPLVKRQRRSEEVNPSDPLRTHTLPSHSAKDHKEESLGQPEQDQAGAVSKQTINSCDDPLRVLHSNGPVSPVKTNIADQAEHE